jgi:[acyl-carrier-protein] S-malonyltransferase
MGQDVAAASEAARAVFAQADDALSESLSRLCFDGPLESLTQTANTQPAIVATSMALLAALRERVPSLEAPTCAAGHSLGEYSALCAAGVMTVADAVRVCRARGRAMQEAVPLGVGAMAAVMGLAGEEVAAICAAAAGVDGEIVSCANFNAPTQTVIAGHAAAVSRASEAAKHGGARVIPLKVSAPFHCALMSPAREGLGIALAAVELQRPNFDVLANIDGQDRADPEAVRSALLEQIDRPVQWLKTIEQMRARGVTHALEIGPGRVLAGLVKRIDRDLKVLNINRVDALDEAAEFLSASTGLDSAAG